MLKSLATALAALALAQAAADRPLPMGSMADWSGQEGEVSYRSGDVRLSLRGEVDAQWEDAIVAVLTVEMPGHAALRVSGSGSSRTFPHRVAVGQWDASRPYVLFQSFTGGAHCCNIVQVVLPEKGRLTALQIGTFDGDYLDELPRDLDGDGVPDFRFVDNSFLYRFAPYASSYGPPRIITIVDGKATDVSARPAFRDIFEQEMRDSRSSCVDEHSNAACAVYVASAARIGRFGEAWREMLASYDRESRWGLEESCRVALADGSCPAGQQIRYADFPGALRAFLLEQGYIEAQRSSSNFIK